MIFNILLEKKIENGKRMLKADWAKMESGTNVERVGDEKVLEKYRMNTWLQNSYLWTKKQRRE